MEEEASTREAMDEFQLEKDESVQEEMTEQADEDSLNLGGNIQLTGFRGVDRGSMVVVKKIVGTYARKFSDQNKDFQQLSLRLKPVHASEKSQIYHVGGKVMISGKAYTSEVEERNLFFVVDKVLKKIETRTS